VHAISTIVFIPLLFAAACTSSSGATSDAETTGCVPSEVDDCRPGTTSTDPSTGAAPTTSTSPTTSTDPGTSTAPITGTDPGSSSSSTEPGTSTSTSTDTEPGTSTGSTSSTSDSSGGSDTTGAPVDPLIAHLVGYWPFNGDSEDHSGVNIDLKLVGDPEYLGSLAPGLGSAIGLDGNDGAIGPGFVKFTTADATIVAWVQADALTGTWNTIVKNWGQGKSGQFHLGLGPTSADTPSNVSAMSTVTAVAPLKTGEWVHTAVVFDSVAGKHLLYINGVEAGSAAYTPPLAPGAATGLGIGVKPNDDGTLVAQQAEVGYWIGRIDEVGMYDVALTPEQVVAVLTNGMNGVQLDGTSE